ncbi:MAG: DNA helicase-2/ATP-dependent DNA helicase PcrA [Myxococcota bacterium]|jgi:DNA helicase-2/ATP-dependent DNA helicase PcrA
MSTTPPDWVPAEDALCTSMGAAIRTLAADEIARRKHLSDQLRSLLEDRAEACNDAVQQEAIDGAIDEVERARVSHERTQRTRHLDAGSPYFGHLVLEEDGRRRELLIAKGSAVDARLPINVVDWRNAPISQIYYEFEEGDEFYAEVAGREREGVVAARRTLDIRGGVLQTAEDGVHVARKRAGNTWQVKRKADEVLERSDQRADPEDHALPDIVALITPDQFGVLTRPDSGVVVLKGQAGSGKTTVALHRIAYLRYHDPERFRLDRILVVMFNKALQTYIHKALSDLDIEGVQVATFHAWASRMLRTAGLSVRFGGQPPTEVTALKQHPAVEALLVSAVDRLGRKLEAWLPVPSAFREAWEATEGSGLVKVGRFFAERPAPERPSVAGLRDKVWRRLHDHGRDLASLLDDAEGARKVLPEALRAAVPAAAAHQARQREAGLVDFADAALLLRIGQLIAARVSGFEVPWYRTLAHIVVDEAQDLSAPAVRVMLDAADAHRCITLAGDPAQTLYDAGGFGLLSGGGAQLDDALQLDTLPIGHRSTRPIMELALRASGASDPALLARTRPGLPVVWLRDDQATPAGVADQIRAFHARRPNTLVAVLTRTKGEADRWAEGLDGLLEQAVRRGHRDAFAFEPGTVVSNVHQVKGLEFDGVVVVEPGSYAARDRNLLHVAITRAADQLWVVSRGSAGLLEG